MTKSSLFKMAAVFAACALLSAGAVMLFRGGLPEGMGGGPVPEHPHLAVVPQDAGRIEYPGELTDYQMIGLYHFTIFLPRGGVTRIEPLGECPVKTLRLHGAGHKFRIGVSPNETLAYEETRKALYATPGDGARLLRRKFDIVSPHTHGSLILREFSIEGMRGFQAVADRPDAGGWTTTTYYLFPDAPIGEGAAPDPPIRVEIAERGVPELPRSIPEGIHAVIAGSSYPGVTGDPLDRLRAAQHARQHEALNFSLFEAITLLCTPHERHALFLVAFAALEMYQFETAREAMKALYKIGGDDVGDVDRLLESIHNTEVLYAKAKAEGAPPPPVQWKPYEIE